MTSHNMWEEWHHSWHDFMRYFDCQILFTDVLLNLDPYPYDWLVFLVGGVASGNIHVSCQHVVVHVDGTAVVDRVTETVCHHLFGRVGRNAQLEKTRLRCRKSVRCLDGKIILNWLHWITSVTYLGNDFNPFHFSQRQSISIRNSTYRNCKLETICRKSTSTSGRKLWCISRRNFTPVTHSPQIWPNDFPIIFHPVVLL